MTFSAVHKLVSCGLCFLNAPLLRSSPKPNLFVDILKGDYACYEGTSQENAALNSR